VPTVQRIQDPEMLRRIGVSGAACWRVDLDPEDLVEVGLAEFKDYGVSLWGDENQPVRPGDPPLRASALGDWWLMDVVRAEVRLPEHHRPWRPRSHGDLEPRGPWPPLGNYIYFVPEPWVPEGDATPLVGGWLRLADDTTPVMVWHYDTEQGARVDLLNLNSRSMTVDRVRRLYRARTILETLRKNAGGCPSGSEWDTTRFTAEVRRAQDATRTRRWGKGQFADYLGLSTTTFDKYIREARTSWRDIKTGRWPIAS
jgi:hypothetical protein